MATWTVQDGAPELGRGSLLRGAGLRAHCASVDLARARADGITGLVDGGGVRPGGHAYELTGLAGAAHDVFAGDAPAEHHAASEFLITVGDLGYIAWAGGRASHIAAGCPGQSRGRHCMPPGAVLRSFEIGQMSRWDDDRDPTVSAWYVLDLLPIQAS